MLPTVLLLISALVVGSLAPVSPEAPTAHSHSRQREIPEWLGAKSVVVIQVTGDSLDVVLIDPRGHKDVWSGEPHRSPIPDCLRKTGYVDHTPAPFVGQAVWETSFWLRPALAGTHRIRVTAVHRTHVTVFVNRLFEPFGCSAGDTLTLASGETREWRVKWSQDLQPGRCTLGLSRTRP
jgi:hypothetical protein